MRKKITLFLGILIAVFFFPQNISAKSVTCNYKSNNKEIEMTIDTDEKKAYFSVEGTEINTIENFKEKSCPEVNTLFYCPYVSKESDTDYSQDIVSYNQSCVEYAYDHSLHTEEYMKKYEVVKSKKPVTSPSTSPTSSPSASPSTTPEEEPEGDKEEENVTWPGLGEDISDVSCETILGDAVDSFQEIFNWFKILAPVLLILFSGIDFAKAVLVEEKDNLKKSVGNCIKRAVAAVAIFFLPLIINLLLNLPGLSERVADALCGIS